MKNGIRILDVDNMLILGDLGHKGAWVEIIRDRHPQTKNQAGQLFQVLQAKLSDDPFLSCLAWYGCLRSQLPLWSMNRRIPQSWRYRPPYTLSYPPDDPCHTCRYLYIISTDTFISLFSIGGLSYTLLQRPLGGFPPPHSNSLD